MDSTTACACHNCSTVLVAAITTRACFAASTSLVILAIMPTAVGYDGHIIHLVNVNGVRSGKVLHVEFEPAWSLKICIPADGVILESLFFHRVRIV